MPPGWYRDPQGYPVLRWWDGYQWTSPTMPMPDTSADTNGVIAGVGGSLAALIGAAIALFTTVTVFSGTSTVWVGAGLAAVGAAATALPRVPVWARVVACLLAAVAIAGAVYDEVQYQQKLDELHALLQQ